MSRAALLAIGTVACSSTPVPVAPLPGGAVYPSTVMGVCIDGHHVVAIDDEHGLASFALESGELAWSAPVEETDTLVHCDSVAVLVASLRGGLFITARSTRDGSAIWVTPTQPLPTWAGSDDVYPTAWRTDGRGYGVHWSASTSWEGGYPPSEEEERQARQSATGGFKVRDGTIIGHSTDKPRYSVPDAPPGTHVSWDARHRVTFDPTRNQTLVTQDRGGPQVAALDGNRASTPLFVIGSTIVTVWSTSVAQASREFDETHVQVQDATGRVVWKRRLRLVEVPEPVP